MPVGDPQQHPPGAAAVKVMCRIHLALQNWSQRCAVMKSLGVKNGEQPGVCCQLGEIKLTLQKAPLTTYLQILIKTRNSSGFRQPGLAWSAAKGEFPQFSPMACACLLL